MPINDWTWFLQVGAGTAVIGDTLLWAGLQPLVVYVSLKKSTFCFLYCSLSWFRHTLHFLAVLHSVVSVWSWLLWFVFLPTIMILFYNNHILYFSKALVQCASKNNPCYSCTKWHYSIPESAKFCIESCKKWGSFIMLLMLVSLFTITDSDNVCICKQLGNVLWVLSCEQLLGILFSLGDPLSLWLNLLLVVNNPTLFLVV